MSPTRRRRRWALIALLAVAGGVAAAVNWHAVVMEIDISPLAPHEPERSAQHDAESPSAKPRSGGKLDAYPETVARPLFSATRRPPVKPQPKPAPAPPPALPEGLRLIGLMENGPDDSRALIRAGQTQGSWLSVGDRIESWTVRSIGKDAVVLEAGSHSHELRLYAKEKSSKPGE
ncbi:MAG: hypothetical protein KJZ80_10000 [Hyphomicrobiaceae bacterium]|nr:hypothetical protein [Hyphomicrobiaceae bacterium]